MFAFIRNRNGYVASSSNPNRHSDNSAVDKEKNPVVDEQNGNIDERLLVLDELRQNEQFCDVTLTLDSGAKIRAHRAILAMSSPFFRALFTNNLPNSVKEGTDEYHIPNITMNVMSPIIQFCYTRRCAISADNVEQLLPVADRLFVQSLKDRCCNFLISQLDISNCIGIHRLARFYFCPDLLLKAKQFILKNFLSVAIASEEWLGMEASEVLEICSNDNLNCKQEESVFSAICRWLACDNSRQRREKVVRALFKTVRIGLLPISFLRETVATNHYIRNNSAIYSIYLSNLRRRTGTSLTPFQDSQVEYFYRHRIPQEVLVAVGGWSGRNASDAVEILDVRTGHWLLSDMTVTDGVRAYHGCVTLNGWDMYMLGGYNGVIYFNSVRKWNLSTKTWMEVAPMNCRRCYVSTVTLNGRIVAIGGFDGNIRQNSVESYNPATNQWSYIAPMQMQRSDAGAAVLNNCIYVCGGFSGQECLSSVEMYDPETQRWTPVAPMNSRRSGVSAVVYNGQLYAIGGFNGRRRVSTVDRYFPNENVWRPVRPLTIARSNFTVAVIDDYLYVIGGYNGTQTIPNVERYSAASNQWTQTTPLNINRSALSCVVVADLPNTAELIGRE